MRRTESNKSFKDRLALLAAEQLVDYEEAKASARAAAGAPRQTPPEQLSQEIACIDLLHRVWPNFDNEAVFESRAPSTLLGDFRLVRELGRGGMGIVYEAEQLSLGRRVAIKTLPFAVVLDPQHLARFQNESRAAATLDHPNIVSVYSVGCEQGVYFYAMQLIHGQSLAEMIAQLKQRANESPTDIRPASGAMVASPPLTPATAELSSDSPGHFHCIARLGIQAADALDYSHAQGILHRDVKPANLLVDESGKLWVTDFGLARLGDEAALTRTGDLLGTLRYMSPERVMDKPGIIDQASDVYSLGATLYELLALEPAYNGVDRHDLLRQIAFDEPCRLRQIDRRIPVDLETIVGKAMDKNPAARYAAAGELAADLRRFIAQQPIKARPATYRDRAWKWTYRHQTFVRIAGAALLLLTAMLAVSTMLVRRALNDTSDLLYATDMSLAYQAWEKGWTDEVHQILDRQSPSAMQTDRRGVEWHLLQQLVQQPDPTVLVGHDGPVNEVAVFPGGQRLASAGADGTLRIWDLPSKKLLRTIDVSDEALSSVAISPDGRYAAVGSTVAYLCDLDQGDKISELFHAETTIESLVFSADGRQIAAGMRYHEIRLISSAGELLDTAACSSRVESLEFLAGTGVLIVPNRREVDSRTLGIIQLRGDGVTSVKGEFNGTDDNLRGRPTHARSSPCGKYIAAGAHYDSTVQLFDVQSRQVIDATPVSRDRLTDLAYAPNGLALAASYQNGLVEYYGLNLADGELPSIRRRPQIIKAHQGEILGIRFVDSGAFATCGADGFIKIWKLSQGNELTFNLTDHAMCAMELSPDGSTILYVSPAEVLLTDAQRGEVQLRRTRRHANYSGAAWSATGNRFAVNCRASNAALVLDREGNKLCELPHGAMPNELAFSPNERLLAVIGERSLQVWDLVTGKEAFQRLLDRPGDSLAFSHDGSLLAFGGKLGFVTIAAASDGSDAMRLPCGSLLCSMAFSPDDRLLATGHNDGVIRLWDLTTGKLRTELTGHERIVEKLAISADGRTLFSAASDGAIRLWSIDHGRAFGCLVRRFGPGIDGANCKLTLSADGRRLAAGYRTGLENVPDVMLWTCDTSVVE